MLNLHYSIREKYNPKLHGVKNKNFLENKFLSFDIKSKNQTILSFEKDMKKKYNNFDEYEIGLYSIIQRGNYFFAINKNSLIKKIQNMWKKYISLKKKYSTIFYLREREVG